MLCPCREISGAYSASEAVTGTSWKYVEREMQWIDAKKKRNMENGSRKIGCKGLARQEGRVTGE